MTLQTWIHGIEQDILIDCSVCTITNRTDALVVECATIRTTTFGIQAKSRRQRQNWRYDIFDFQCVKDTTSGFAFPKIDAIVVSADPSMTESLQREASLAKAHLQQKDREIELLKEQNNEITEELAWVVKDLLRLKKVETDQRCHSWLLSSEGLSTVLAHPNNVTRPSKGRQYGRTRSSCLIRSSKLVATSTSAESKCALASESQRIRMLRNSYL
jgi:hypothetical protein